MSKDSPVIDDVLFHNLQYTLDNALTRNVPLEVILEHLACFLGAVLSQKHRTYVDNPVLTSRLIVQEAGKIIIAHAQVTPKASNNH